MARKVNIEKLTKVLSIGIIACCICPFLYLCLFAYPNAEDLSLSIIPKDYGLWYSIKQLFLNFDGRYFTNFLFGINPLAQGSYTSYPHAVLLSLSMYIISNYFLLRSFQISNRFNTLILSGLFSALYLVLLPSPVHAIYWLGSSIVYLVPITLFNFLVGLMVKLDRADSYFNKLWLTLLATLNIIAIIGTNEMFLLIVNFLFLLLIGYNVWKKSIVKHLHYVYFFSISTLASINFIIAPGIRLRWLYVDEERGTVSFIESIFLMFRDTAYFTGNIFSEVILVIIVFIIAWWTAKWSELQKFAKKHLIGISLVMLVTVFCSMLAFYAPMGAADIFPYRVFNIFLYFFLITIVIAVVVLFGKQLKKIPSTVPLLLSIVLLIAIPFSKNTESAYRFIITKKHVLHKKEMLNIFNTLDNSSDKDTIYLKNPTNQVSIISFTPYLDNNNVGWNEQYEKYFNVKKVIELE